MPATVAGAAAAEAAGCATALAIQAPQVMARTTRAVVFIEKRWRVTGA